MQLTRSLIISTVDGWERISNNITKSGFNVYAHWERNVIASLSALAFSAPEMSIEKTATIAEHQAIELELARHICLLDCRSHVLSRPR